MQYFHSILASLSRHALCKLSYYILIKRYNKVFYAFLIRKEWQQVWQTFHTDESKTKWVLNIHEKKSKQVKKCETVITQLSLHFTFLFIWFLKLPLHFDSWGTSYDSDLGIFFNDLYIYNQENNIEHHWYENCIWYSDQDQNSFLYNHNLPERSDKTFQKTIPYDRKWAQHFAWIQSTS